MQNREQTVQGSLACGSVRRGKEQDMKIYIIKMPRFLAKLLTRRRTGE